MNHCQYVQIILFLSLIDSYQNREFQGPKILQPREFQGPKILLQDFRYQGEKILESGEFQGPKTLQSICSAQPRAEIFGTHVWYGLRSKRSKEEEKREKTPVRVATTFCLCTPKGSARTPLGPISSTYCILLLLFHTQRLIDRYCGSIPKFSFLGCLNCNDNIVWWKNYLWHDHKNKIGDNPSPPGIHLFQTKHAQNFPEIWTPPPLHQVCNLLMGGQLTGRRQAKR